MENSLGNKEIMAKNIQYYMNINNLSRQDLCRAIGVKYTTLTDWIKGNAYPRIDKIELMANYFGISKSDLVEMRKPQPPSVTPAEFDYIQKIRLLDEHSQNLIMTIIENEYQRVPENKRYLKTYAESFAKLKEVKEYERKHNEEENQ